MHVIVLLHVQTITVQPAPPPVFDPVTDQTITCAQADVFAATNLNYTNGETGSCLISGSVLGVVTGTFDECGGTLVQTWTYTDACNSITAVQTITVQPAPPPVFDPVTDQTITVPRRMYLQPLTLTIQTEKQEIA
jgi:hypothetical protein